MYVKRLLKESSARRSSQYLQTSNSRQSYNKGFRLSGITTASHTTKHQKTLSRDSDQFIFQTISNATPKVLSRSLFETNDQFQKMRQVLHQIYQKVSMAMFNSLGHKGRLSKVTFQETESEFKSSSTSKLMNSV